MTLAAALGELARHPYQRLVLGWNWKTALLSTVFRGTIFFVVNLRSGWDAATAALVTEAIYRMLTAGFYGAITQSLRRVEPGWKAAAAGLMLLPAFQHTVEFLVHWAGGTAHVAASVAASAGFTCLSTLFNLYAMRRGAMLVEASGAAPLREDLKQMPELVGGFLLAGPLGVCRLVSGWRRAG